jgi:hypothetical protein
VFVLLKGFHEIVTLFIIDILMELANEKEDSDAVYDGFMSSGDSSYRIAIRIRQSNSVPSVHVIFLQTRRVVQS